MKKIFAAIISLLLCMTLAVPAFAAINETSVIDWEKTGTIIFKYNETVEGPDPVVSAEFTAYKVADFGSSGEFLSLIGSIKDEELYTENDDPSVILERVLAAYASGIPAGGAMYKAVTNDAGHAEITGMALGLYVVVESVPAVSHFESTPFFASLPFTENNEWVYTLTAEPKSNPGGDLIITKKVAGDNGELDREWHFLVTFMNFSKPVKYVKSTGEEGTVESGGTVALKNGESITIKTIPVGVAYEIKEQEANQDGYTTTVTTNATAIRRKTQVTADFVNTRYKVPENIKGAPTGDSNIAYIAGAAALFAMLTAGMLFFGLRRRKKNER